MPSQRFLILASSALVFLVLACGGGPKLIQGDTFNDYFPEDRDGHMVVVTTEKSGFAQAALKKEDTEVATISISDLAEDEEGREKFKASTTQVAGYPALPRGEAGTAILVGNRFQVQVRSKSDAFSEQDRKDWLLRCRLDSLAGL